MTTSEILKIIDYLKTSINDSLDKYQNTSDIDEFKYLKSEISYIYKVYKRELNLASIDEKRFNILIEKLDSLFDKYLIEEFDYYGNILRARYENDLHSEYVRQLREDNKKRRKKTNG